MAFEVRDTVVIVMGSELLLLMAECSATSLEGEGTLYATHKVTATHACPLSHIHIHHYSHHHNVCSPERSHTCPNPTLPTDLRRTPAVYSCNKKYAFHAVVDCFEQYTLCM